MARFTNRDMIAAWVLRGVLLCVILFDVVAVRRGADPFAVVAMAAVFVLVLALIVGPRDFYDLMLFRWSVHWPSGRQD